MGKWHEEIFHQGRYTNGKEAHMMMSNIIKEMQIRTTMRCHCKPVSVFIASMSHLIVFGMFICTLGTSFNLLVLKVFCVFFLE